MIMRSEKVPLSPSSALQTMYFWSRLGLQHRLPFDAGGKARAAAAAQAGLGDFLDDVGGRHVERAAQALEPAMGFVIFQRERIGDAAARKGQPLLLREIGDRLDQTELQGMIAIGTGGAESPFTSDGFTGP